MANELKRQLSKEFMQMINMHINILLTPFIIREMNIKTKIVDNLSLNRMATVKNNNKQNQKNT